jgi:hypothetical protein
MFIASLIILILVLFICSQWIYLVFGMISFAQNNCDHTHITFLYVIWPAIYVGRVFFTTAF